MDGVTDVSTLEGRALDHAVGKIEGVSEYVLDRWGAPEYSKIWTLGGPIIERERIAVTPDDPECSLWDAYNGRTWHKGRTPLEAAMRAYVAAKGGK